VQVVWSQQLYRVGRMDGRVDRSSTVSVVGPRERIVTAAAELMYDRGYESVGVQALCERADVRKGSFYERDTSARMWGPAAAWSNR